MTSREYISDKMLLARKNKHLSQEQIGLKIGISRQEVGSIERLERKQPNKDTLKQMAEILDLDPNELYSAFDYTTDKEQAQALVKSPVTALTELEISARSFIPVYADIDKQKIVNYISLDSGHINSIYEAYMINGYALKPLFNEGDTIVIDPELKRKENSYVLCQIEGKGSIQPSSDYSCQHSIGVIMYLIKAL